MDQVDTRRVDLLALLTGEAKGEDVPQGTEEEEDRVEQREHHAGHPGGVKRKAEAGIVRDAAWVSCAGSHVTEVPGET